MPVVLGAVAAAVAYALACYAAVVYAVLPFAPFAVLAGAGAGVLIVVGVLVGTLVGLRSAATVTAAEGVARLPAVRSRFPRDSARPHYLFAQSRADLAAALRTTGVTVVAAWSPLVLVFGAGPWVLLAWPLLALPLAAALALTAGAVGSALAVYALVATTLGVAWLGWLAAVGSVRGADLAVRTLRRARATCPHPECNFRTRLPAFRCGTCDRVHRDIRAGRLGVFRRECACGGLLPTTVLGAADLAAVCPMCDRPLRAGAGALTDVVLPVVGPVSAGKSRFVLAGLVALGREVAAAGGKLVAADPESAAVHRRALELVERRDQTTKTDADRPPPAVTVELRHSRGAAQLHLFDAAGEFFADREQNDRLTYLDRADGLVFVLDPFSVRAVVDDLVGPLAERLATAQPARLGPEESYLVTAQRLRHHRAPLDRWPLAVAVVKADLLLGLPPAAGLTPAATSAQVRAWLVDRGLDHTVDFAERDFAEVRYFLVSSLEIDGGCSPAGPLRWLLGRCGAALPS